MSDKRKGKGRKSTAQELRAFRHGVSILKKKGLVSKKIDARKRKLTRYMKAKVKYYEGVISGRETVVWKNPDIVKQYVEGGKYKGAKFGKNTAIIVPKEDAQNVRLNKAELLTVETTIGNVVVEKVVLPISVHNIEDFLAECIRDPSKIDALKGPDQLFGFTFYGYKSTQTFTDAREIFDHLQKYDDLSGEDNASHWENFVLVRIRSWADATTWENGENPKREFVERGAKRRNKKETQDRRYALFKFTKMTEAEKAERHRQEERRRREKLKTTLTDADKAKRQEKWKQTKRAQRGGLKRKKN